MHATSEVEERSLGHKVDLEPTVHRRGQARKHQLFTPRGRRRSGQHASHLWARNNVPCGIHDRKPHEQVRWTLVGPIRVNEPHNGLHADAKELAATFCVLNILSSSWGRARRLVWLLRGADGTGAATRRFGRSAQRGWCLNGTWRHQNGRSVPPVSEPAECAELAVATEEVPARERRGLRVLEGAVITPLAPPTDVRLPVPAHRAFVRGVGA
mmetsp:Transcript_10268/g.32415  ORF Transcript_10268/g.32415 Transcript_10268/m.32415 type:complete len:212 (+) Transcript_10268:232-867(+)